MGQNEMPDAVCLKTSTQCPAKPLSQPEMHWFCILNGSAVLTKSVKCNHSDLVRGASEAN